MIRFALIVAALLTLPLSAYKNADTNHEQYLIFLDSIKNQLTFNYFTVVKIKDLNTGLTKEICSKGWFLDDWIFKDNNFHNSKYFCRLNDLKQNK